MHFEKGLVEDSPNIAHSVIEAFTRLIEEGDEWLVIASLVGSYFNHSCADNSLKREANHSCAYCIELNICNIRNCNIIKIVF